MHTLSHVAVALLLLGALAMGPGLAVTVAAGGAVALLAGGAR